MSGHKLLWDDGLPGSWSIAALGDLFEIQQGKALNKKAREGKSPHPFLRTSNVLWGELDVSSVDVMDFTAAEQSKYALQPGDLFVCEGGEIGRTSIWSGEIEGCYYQNHLHRCRAREQEVDPHFYMYWMRFAVKLKNLYAGHGNVTTIANLSKSRLAAFEVAVPPLPEQQAIAHVLLTVQRAKEATEQVIVAAQELKKSLMPHLFGGDWPVRQLGELTEKPQYGYTESAEHDPVGPRFLRITDIQNGSVRWASVPFCKCEPKDLAKHALELGDVVVARIGATTGKAFYVSEVPEPAVFASYLIRLRPRSDLNARYLGYFTESEAYWRQINTEKGGRLKTGVNARTLTGLHIPLPDLDGQIAVVGRLEAVDRKIAAEEARRDALATLFDSFLHDLMTARLRVRDLEVPV